MTHSHGKSGDSVTAFTIEMTLSHGKGGYYMTASQDVTGVNKTE
jgi:hypothetical protein